MVNLLLRSASICAVLNLSLAPAVAGSALPSLRASRASTVPQPAHIDKNGLLILVRSTLLALDQANQTGNYTVLRDMGSPTFEQANTAARLGDIFRPLRSQSLDLSGTAVLDPQLTLLPQVEASGKLHMTGFFPSVPMQINFDLFFTPSGNRWRLESLEVDVGSAMPTPGNDRPDTNRPAASLPTGKVAQAPLH